MEFQKPRFLLKGKTGVFIGYLENESMLFLNSIERYFFISVFPIRQVTAQLVGTTDHRKVVVRERPSFEVRHSFLGYSILLVMNFSLVR